MLGNDGRVAEQGSYKDLSSRKDGAFTKLMEWQMSGGETTSVARTEAVRDMAVSGEAGRGPPTEKEEIQLRLDSGAEEAESEPEAEEEQEANAQGSKAPEVADSAVNSAEKK